MRLLIAFSAALIGAAFLTLVPSQAKDNVLPFQVLILEQRSRNPASAFSQAVLKEAIANGIISSAVIEHGVGSSKPSDATPEQNQSENKKESNGPDFSVGRQVESNQASKEDPPKKPVSSFDKVYPGNTDEQRLIGMMRQTLRDLLTELNKHPDKQLILIMDLDGTVYWHPKHFENTEEFGVADMGTVQLAWFEMFSDFLLKEDTRKQIKLIYNTARFWTSVQTTTFDSGTSGFQAKSVNMDIVEPDSGLMRFLVDKYKVVRLRQYKVLGVPMPDALITGGGTHIQLGIGLKESISQEEISSLNKSLPSWVTEDDCLYVQAEKKLSVDLGMRGYFREYGSIQKFGSVRDSTLEYFNRVVQELNSELSISPIILMTSECTLIQEVCVQNVTVNKGSAARILVDYMLRNQTEGEPKPTLVFAFGDELMDMTFTRPDLEGEVLGKALSGALAKREARIATLGVHSIGTYSETLWTASFLRNIDVIAGANPEAKEATMHRKVRGVGNMGFQSMLQGMVNFINMEVP